MRNIQLVSSQFPSGVAWLLNFLIEIDILAYRDNDTSILNTWNYNEADKSYRLKKEEEILKQWMPALSEKQQFYFKDNIAVRWSHEFPSKKNLGEKTILLVRDGRDAVYSNYKREIMGESFLEMLDDSYPPFGLRPADTWALMNLMWSNVVAENDLFVIKFEDIKTNPYTVLPRLLQFLGISREQSAIEAAIESSSFERAKKHEEAYRKTASHTQFALVNRKGEPGEWRKTYTAEQLAFFDGLPSLALKQYGYEPKTESDAERLKNLFGLHSKQESVNKNANYLASMILEKMYDSDGTSPRQTAEFVTKHLSFLIKALDSITDTDGLKREIKNEKYRKMMKKVRAKLSSYAFLRKIRKYQLQAKKKVRNVFSQIKTVTDHSIRKIKKPKIPTNSDGKVLIHLGCGQYNDERFINVDAEPLPHVHYIQDIKKLDVFPNDFSDLVYSSHALEHISHLELADTLKEWARVLKKGGTIRLSVPNFDKLLEIYSASGDNIRSIIDPLMGSQTYEYNYHKSAFTEKYLSDLLAEAGFIDVRRWNSEKTEYQFNDFARTFKASLNLEADKK